MRRCLKIKKIKDKGGYRYLKVHDLKSNILYKTKLKISKNIFPQLFELLSKEQQRKVQSYIDLTSFRSINNIHIEVNTKFRFHGRCCIYSGVIEINKFYMPNLHLKTVRKELIDTVLHELAHLFAGHLHGDFKHGEPWKTIAADLGAKPLIRYDMPKIAEKAYNKINGKKRKRISR